MDPVMQAVFGTMPIGQLSAVQAATGKNNSLNTIILVGGVALVLGVTVYILYKQNQKLREQLELQLKN